MYGFLAVILVEGAKNLSARLEEGVKWSGYQLVSKVSVWEGGWRSLGLKKVELSSRISWVVTKVGGEGALSLGITGCFITSLHFLGRPDADATRAHLVCAYCVCAADVHIVHFESVQLMFLVFFTTWPGSSSDVACWVCLRLAFSHFQLFAIFFRVMALQLWLECLGWWPVPSPSHPAKRLVGALWDSFIDAKVCPRVSHNFDMLETHLNFAQFWDVNVYWRKVIQIFSIGTYWGWAGRLVQADTLSLDATHGLKVFRVFRVFQSIST